MKKYIVDFENVTNYSEFYEVLIKGLEFPEWCGKNPDAIWDLLTGWLEYPALVEIKNSAGLEGWMLKKEFDLLVETLEETEEWYDEGEFSFVILS